MRKLSLVVVLVLTSNTLFAQAMFPVTNKRIVDDLWCDLMANKLAADTKHWQNLIMDKHTKNTTSNSMQAGTIISELSADSTVYKNLCEGSVYLLIKDTINTLLPLIRQ